VNKEREGLQTLPYLVITPTQLANWILEQQLNVRLQLQLHKILWGDQQGK
jgi:organic radical activating enzyme